MQNFAKVRVSEIRRLRYVGKSHVACLLIMFLKGRLAMPSVGRENVRHATLLFCALGGRAFVGKGAEESDQAAYE